MCISPRLVSRRSSTRCDLTTGLAIVNGETGKSRIYKRLRPSSEDFFYNNYLVPCGHCSQCLKKRQNDLAARCAAEANKRGSMIFVTLTYRDDTVPLAMHVEQVNKDTGEIENIIKNSSGSFVDFTERGSDFDLACRFGISKLDKKKVRYLRSEMVSLDGRQFDYVVTPSLCRRDVQLWIKSARVQYEREFHLPLKKFSYVCCGEYGPNTFRPHYHLAFFGLSKVVVDWICSRWNRQFGFTYVQQVNAVNSDGSNGFVLCSKYIGKYMTKGVFECESVKNGSALKPRLMCSIGVGNYEGEKVVSDNVVSYYRCYDLVGVYNINTGLRSDGSSLSEADYQLLASEVLKRSTFVLGSAIYPIPNKVKHYIWYEKNANGALVSSRVRRKISSIIQSDFFEDFVRKLTKDYSSEHSSEILSQISEFISCQFVSDEVAEKRGMQNLRSFYSKSIF